MALSSLHAMLLPSHPARNILLHPKVTQMAATEGKDRRGMANTSATKEVSTGPG